MAVTQKGEYLVFDRATKEVVALSKSLPGKRRWKDGVLYIQSTGNNIQKVLEFFPPIAELNLPAIQGFLSAGKIAEETRQKKKEEVPPGSWQDFPFKTQPLNAQIKAFSLSRESKVFAYFMEMGMGKTKLAIDVGADLYLKGWIDIIVVLAPNGVHRQWVNSEIPRHMSAEVQYDAFAHSSKWLKKDKESYQKVMASKNLRIVTIASESLSAGSAMDLLQELVQLFGKRMLLVIDESHQYSNASAKRTKMLLKLAPSIEYKRIMTGSPITDGIEKLFPQFAILNTDILGHTSQTSFNREFCRLEQIYGAPRGAMRVIGYQNLKKLQDRVEGFTFRATKDEYLDLPEKIYQTVEVPFTDEQRKIYRDIKHAAAAEVNGVEITAPLAISAISKMRQVTGGSILDNDGVAHEVPTNKLSTLLNICETNPGGGIIWVTYTSEAKRVAEALKKAGYSVGVHTGSTTPAERTRITTPGAVDWLVANWSASTGLNLQHWRLNVYYSNTFNYAERVQSEDRTHRVGQKHSVLYIDLVIPGTVDEAVVLALAQKREIADLVWIPERLLQDTFNFDD